MIFIDISVLSFYSGVAGGKMAGGVARQETADRSVVSQQKDTIGAMPGSSTASDRSTRSRGDLERQDRCSVEQLRSAGGFCVERGITPVRIKETTS